MKQFFQVLLASCIFLTLSHPSFGDSYQLERLEQAESDGVKVRRNENALILDIKADVKSPISIPRMAGSLKAVVWADEGSDKLDPIQVKPEPDRWEINWKQRPEGEAVLLLIFDAKPLLMDELKPLEPMGDGSFYLPAHFATTNGEKIRYEPQTYKNTVGFWVGKQDQATWTLQLDEPGRFNVAVLQGCGKGQGGSLATMSFISPVKDITPKIDFEVVETGHWQNFQWVQLGEVELRHKGEVEVSVAPKQIKKAALMDIRAIHLIRLPDKK